MYEDSIHLLLIESNPEERDRLRQALNGGGRTQFELEHLADPEAAFARLDRGGVDVVIVDVSAAGERCADLVRHAAKRLPDVPVVLVADDLEGPHALQAVSAGAHECLTRDEVLGPALARAVGWALERHRLLARAHRMAFLDPLTGLYNRQGFLAVTEPLWRLAARTGRMLSLLLLHFDRVAEIAEQHGEDVAEHAIDDAARVLRDPLRESDVLARLARDRFGVLLNDAGHEVSETVLMRLLESVEEYNSAEERRWRLSFTVAFAHSDPKSPRPVDQLVLEAERALEERRMRSFRLG